MLLSGIATLAAFLLVGLGSKSERKSPLFMIGGFAAFALSIYFHVVAYQTVLQATSAISAEIGIGFLLLAGLLTKERKEAKSYFYLGGVSLLVSVLLFISIKFFSPSSD